MSVCHILQVSGGNIIDSFRGFLSTLWSQAGLDALLAPVRQPGSPLFDPAVIFDPARIEGVNPFAPCMTANAASLLPEILQLQRGARVAALLRPCELRTFTEIQKRKRAACKPGLITIGVDCLGTYPLDVYVRLAAGHGPDLLSQESLTEPHPPTARLRSACQMCDAQEPWDADVLVGTIGVASRQYILIGARDEATFADLGLHAATGEKASEEQIAYRSSAVARLTTLRKPPGSPDLSNGASGDGDLSALLACVSRCSLCADCLDTCPLYCGELAGLLGVGSAREGDRPLLSELVSVSRWLASCTRCGVCEDACDRGVPLMSIVGSISRRIQTSLRYKAGDPAQKLPWVA